MMRRLSGFESRRRRHYRQAVVMTVCLLSAVFCRAGEPSTLITNLEAGKKQVVVAYGTSLNVRSF